MARTRAETEADIILNTGRSDKSAYIIRQMDNALKIACTKHVFNDSLHLADAIALTEDATSVSIASLTESSGTSLGTGIDIITARIIDATKLPFTSGGTHVVVAGDVITGSTSGATAYVTYADLISGSYAAGTAAGNLWIDNKSGTFTAAEEIEDADANNLATVTSDPGFGGSRNAPLKLKNRQWWDKNIINPEDNLKGWPTFGLHFGTNIMFEGPLDNEIELLLRVQTIPTYTADGTECPIELLDTFVEQYVTAMTFLSIGMTEKYVSWYIMALGRNYDRKGIAGGALSAAINKDRSDAAEDKKLSRDYVDYRHNGISVLNNTTGAANYGNTETWI